MAEKAARQIAQTNLNELRKELNEQIINDTFAEVVRPKAVAWADRIKTGKHQIFDDLVGKPMRKIVRDTLQKWEVVIKDQPILAGLPLPTPLGGTEVMSTELIESVVAKAPGVSADVVVGTTVGVAVGAMIGSFVFPFIGTYLGGALGGVIGAVFGGGVGTETREQQIYEGVKQSLIASISEPQRKSDVVSRQAKRIETLRMGIIREFQTAFEQPMNALVARHEETMNLFSEQAERRKAIAETHRLFRVEKLEPLRAEIARFEQQVKEDLEGREPYTEEEVRDL